MDLGVQTEHTRIMAGGSLAVRGNLQSIGRPSGSEGAEGYIEVYEL